MTRTTRSTLFENNLMSCINDGRKGKSVMINEISIANPKQSLHNIEFGIRCGVFQIFFPLLYTWLCSNGTHESRNS